MNRRGFLRSLATAAGAVVLAPVLKFVPAAPTVLRFKGIPIVPSAFVPRNRICFINPRWPHWRP